MPLHLSAALEKLGQVVVHWHLSTTLLVAGRLRSRDVLLLGGEQDLVESGRLLGFPLLEKCVARGVWCLLVLDNGVDLPNGEIDPLGILILIVDLDPLLDILSLLRLNVLADFELSKILLLQYHVILGSLWWLTKLGSI